MKQSDKTEKNNVRRITAKEMLEIVSQQWATVYDIQKIGNCGKNQAQKVKKEIKEKVKNDLNKDLPRGLVPMEQVVDYYHININYLKKVTK